MLKSEPRQTWRALVYGQEISVQGVEIIRKIRGVDKVVKLVVIDNHSSHPMILLSLDIHLTPAEIIERYGARFSIELLIRECKSEMGMSQYQCYTTLALHLENGRINSMLKNQSAFKNELFTFGR
ncbi:MAG: hypothetical protein HQM12_20170 [SAR324 cluster bacterium]|nr:hypothetical protein [SAR324 cluster bacterium]